MGLDRGASLRRKRAESRHESTIRILSVVEFDRNVSVEVKAGDSERMPSRHCNKLLIFPWSKVISHGVR